MGLAIGGNGLGGMLGRLASAYMADVLSWRYAMAAIGVAGLIATVIFWKTLPASRNFIARPPSARAMIDALLRLVRDARLVPLYALGFLLMGVFVTAYNYIGYHLIDAPYSLSQAAAGSVFIVYPVGIFASAFIGGRADRVGRPRMMLGMATVMFAGVLLMATRPLALVVLGITTLTFGFFGGHSVASSWIGLRAKTGKAQASALYLFFYYIGASVAGSFGGTVWDHWRWMGVELFLGALIIVAVGATLLLGDAAAVRSAPTT
jgi:YNFM family putative membrane transporter